MKVFISWSGETSKKIAEALSEWIPSVLQAVKPFFSPDDVAKGTRWFSEISGTLQECEMGLICLTPDNLNAPWILFEAGALSKNVGKAKVCTLLFILSPTDVQGPLAQLNHTRFDKEDMKRLLGTINKELGEQSLSSDVLDNVFEKWWPDLEKQVRVVLSSARGETPPGRPQQEILEEILALVRTIAAETETRRASEEKISHPITPVRNVLSLSEWLRIMEDAKRYVGLATKPLPDLGESRDEAEELMPD